MLAAPSPRRDIAVTGAQLKSPRELQAPIPAEVNPEPAAQDNSPPAATAEPVAEPAASPAPAPPPATPPQAPSPPVTSAPAAPQPSSPQPEPQVSAPAPLFRSRPDLAKPGGAPVPAVIPILRAPDDPGIDDEAPSDEFVEQIGTPKAQAGGWRGFLSRWGG